MNRDKIKIRICIASYMDLENDMKLFHFYKPNGTFNKNKFYNKVIAGMFNNFKVTTNLVADILTEEYKKGNINQLTNLALKINEGVTAHRYSDKAFYHQKDVYIQITKDTREMYNEIELNYLVNNTLSEFIRNLLNEYLYMAQFERERCVFCIELNTLIDAINSSKEVILNTIDEDNIRVRLLLTNNHEDRSFTYVVGYRVTGDGMFPISIKLSDITSITSTNKYYELSEQEIDYLYELLGTGIDKIGKTIKSLIIKFDDEGLKKFGMDTFGPSAYYNEDDETFKFYCDEEKMFEYLIQYGKHAKVISPQSLKDKLNTFHLEAIDEE